ncbi:MAG: UbiD family decarboxylase [Deltaproteobacteria bacterium]|nr:UbiD family decarboxylase [Deltaproteobacteria bacterium]MBI3076888.1 UbiD family decarboxylase [Deltaproteobacteria bacterium]
MTPGHGYHDLREHIEALDRAGLLVRVAREIDKNTEMHPLVRWQFRGGLTEEQRRAFLFERVVDSRGQGYPGAVLVGGLAASTHVYAVGMGCRPEELADRWEHAFSHLIEPVLVEAGPVHEEVHLGPDLEALGLDEFPIPISTPGFDNAPYTTCSHWITKDPETGIRNVGNYRGHVKARTRLGIYPMAGQHVYLHWQKAKARGAPLEAALVVGSPPVVSYATVQKIPYGVDELAVAGGLAGEPIQVVRCKTVALEVPADAEIVIEGRINTEWLEPEGPFGESHGYMHPRMLNPFCEITAITHRKAPIWVSFISQVTPSESSVIKKVGYDVLFLKHLREHCHIKSVLRVVMHEPLTNLRKFIVLQMRKPSETEVWRALHSAATFHPGVGKILVAVDEDIDPEDVTMVLWALSYRMRPHRDVHIITGMEKGHAPPFVYTGDTYDEVKGEGAADDSAMLINAILKEPFPPVSLPRRDFMEHARKIWEELGLPALRPESPWHGYSLGQWDEELEQEAELALKGEHYRTGEKLAKRRVRVR